MTEETKTLVQLMVDARLNPVALARKASLPLSTILKAMKGLKLSPVIDQGLRKVCQDEIDSRP